MRESHNIEYICILLTPKAYSQPHKHNTSTQHYTRVRRLNNRHIILCKHIEFAGQNKH